MRNIHADSYLRLVEICFRDAAMLKQKREELVAIVEQEHLLYTLRENMTPRTYERWCEMRRKDREACLHAIQRYEQSLRDSVERLDEFLDTLSAEEDVTVDDPYVERFRSF